METPIRCFKLTDDDWYPCFKIDGWYGGVEGETFVEVSLLALRDGEYRVCVWGADDCGMELDLPHTEHDKAVQLFFDVIQQSRVSMGYLKKRGFVNA